VSSDRTLRRGAARVLDENRRGRYTIPAHGLYPYQWCWDTGPIALGWAARGNFAHAWDEIESLLSAQWPSGMVPHIVFWRPSDDYFPGPDVWETDRDPPSTGLTQPPLPVTAAAALARTDPDTTRARARLGRLWLRLTAWLEWIARARAGPHGAAVIVHPWESGMDNSPSWDEPLTNVPETSHEHLARRDTATVAAPQRPTDREYRRFLGIVKVLRDHGWDTEHQLQDSPFAVEDPAFTSITARAAVDLASVAPMIGADSARLEEIASGMRKGARALWDEERTWFRPYDLRADTSVGPATALGLLPLWAKAPTRAQAASLLERLEHWRSLLAAVVPTCDPTAPDFEAERYWRGPIWVIVNWMVADGFAAHGYDAEAAALRAETRALVERHGFCEYYDPRDTSGIGGRGFSWSAALTLAWLTA